MTWLGPAADDEFLLLDDLELAPVRSSLSRPVLGVGVLCDEPFPSVRERLLVQRTTIAANERAQPENARVHPIKNTFELGPALDERKVSQIASSVSQDVERDERHAAGAGHCVPVDSREMNAALQVLEAGWLVIGIECDDLAVDDGRLLQAARPFLQRCDELGELAGLFVAEARPETHLTVRNNLRDGADAVVLRLVNKLR